MKQLFFTILFAFSIQAWGTQILIPMDNTQKDHLKAYGITYWVLGKDAEAKWLLNYRDGSFAFEYKEEYEKECRVRGVTYEVLTDARYNAILAEIADPEVNMESVQLLKAPKIAVYSPKSKQPWDDAVTMVLTYAEIPYDIIFDDEVLDG
ncbi:MAG TPA: asparagine synthetase B, partial [Bacteroidia bacterium]|nr:asparagine synthetase B [Bacteroidia bacterium]